MPASSAPGACWRIAVPPLIANAGAAGARLSITLLRPTVVTLYAGHAFVLHDPAGLTGERLLAALHRAARRHPTAPAPGDGTGAVRWVVVQPPLADVWREVHALDWRAVWRQRRRRWSRDPVPPRDAGRRAPGEERSPARVAEAGAPAYGAAAPVTAQPSLLLVSEAERADALPAAPAARLLARALRQQWALFTVTRQGPAAFGRERGPSADTPDWRTHLVCRSGRLAPLVGPTASEASRE